MNDKLRGKRSQLGMTQAQLADALKVAVITINRWEQGKNKPSDYYISTLTKVLHATAEELGLETNERKKRPVIIVQTSDNLAEVVQSSVAAQPLTMEEHLAQIPCDTVLQENTSIHSPATAPQAHNQPSSPLNAHRLFRPRRTVTFSLLILCVLVLLGGVLFETKQIFAFVPASGAVPVPTPIGSLKVTPPPGAKVVCGAHRNKRTDEAWTIIKGGYIGRGYNNTTYSLCNGLYSYIPISAGPQATFFPNEHIPASKHFVDIWIYIPLDHAEAAADYTVVFTNISNDAGGIQSWSICQSNYRYWYRLGTVHIPDKATSLMMEAVSPSEGTPCKGINASKNSSGTFAEDVAALYFH